MFRLFTRSLALLSVVLFAGTFAREIRGENWPQWRGPTGDSVSRESQLPVTWSEANGVAWKTSIPAWGDSTPAIWEDAIFLSTQQDDKLLAIKIRKSTGEIEWTRQAATGTMKREGAKREQKFHQLHNLATPSPTTDGKVAIFHFGTGDLVAFDFAGKQLWSRNLTQDYGGYTIWWGHANSPVLHDNLVISVCMQDTLEGVRDQLAPNYVVAHDKLTGKEVWKTSRSTEADAEQCDSYTTPIFTKVDGRVQMIVMGGNQLDAYDPASGKQLWFIPGLIGGRTVTSPTVGHDLVFASTGMRGPVHALGLKAAKNGKELGPGRRDKQDLLAWKEDQGTPDSCSPVLWEDLLFVVADNGIASCLNARTGHRQWRERLKGDYKASPVAAEGRVYFLNTKGLCTVVAATPRFDKLNENQLDDETIASPAISDGRVYIRGKNALYAIKKP